METKISRSSTDAPTTSSMLTNGENQADTIIETQSTPKEISFTSTSTDYSETSTLATSVSKEFGGVSTSV